LVVDSQRDGRPTDGITPRRPATPPRCKNDRLVPHCMVATRTRLKRRAVGRKPPDSKPPDTWSSVLVWVIGGEGLIGGLTPDRSPCLVSPWFWFVLANWGRSIRSMGFAGWLRNALRRGSPCLAFFVWNPIPSTMCRWSVGTNV